MAEILPDAMDIATSSSRDFETVFSEILNDVKSDKRLLTWDEAQVKTLFLVWSEGFKEDFYKMFGRMPDSDSPVLFDVDIRMYCAELLKDLIRDIYNTDCIEG